MRVFSVLTVSAFLAMPAMAADLGTYRPGTPYNSTVAAGADICESHCAGDAQCRGWNYVKPNPRASGVCEFLSSVSTPIASQISISGEGFAGASLSPRVQTGATNTVRVGTQIKPTDRTVRVGQTTPNRRIVREAVPQHATAQPAATRPIANMSLTEQQNRYRQGTQSSPRPVPAPQRPPAFRPILDGTGQGYAQPQLPPRPQPQLAAIPQQRRMTGPRRLTQPPTRQMQPAQSPRMTAGRPPIGQPIPAPTHMARRSVEAPKPALAPQSHNPVALSPEQAQRSLFGRLNDDIGQGRATSPDPAGIPSDMPVATAVPSVPVSAEPMDVLAGGR